MASKVSLSLMSAAEAVNKSFPLRPRQDRTSATIETWPSLAYFLLIGGAMSAIALVGVILQLTAIETIVLCATAGGLVGGLLFTILASCRS